MRSRLVSSHTKKVTQVVKPTHTHTKNERRQASLIENKLHTLHASITCSLSSSLAGSQGKGSWGMGRGVKKAAAFPKEKPESSSFVHTHGPCHGKAHGLWPVQTCSRRLGRSLLLSKRGRGRGLAGGWPAGAMERRESWRAWQRGKSVFIHPLTTLRHAREGACAPAPAPCSSCIQALTSPSPADGAALALPPSFSITPTPHSSPHLPPFPPPPPHTQTKTNHDRPCTHAARLLHLQPGPRATPAAPLPRQGKDAPCAGSHGGRAHGLDPAGA